MGTMQLNKTSYDVEEQKHNAMIKERYQKLQNAIAEQFAEETTTARASVIAPERPAYFDAPVVNDEAAVEQVPQVTEFLGSRPESPVFTAEKFNGISDYATESAYAAVAAPTFAPVVKPLEITQVAKEESYSLTPFAKVVMAVFTAVVVAMLTLISVNTQIIRQKSVRLQNLEEKKQELMEKNEEIQRQIEIAQSEETIRNYAASLGR